MNNVHPLFQQIINSHFPNRSMQTGVPTVPKKIVNPLNNKSSVFFHKIIEGLDYQNNCSKKIDNTNEAYMPLCVEIIGQNEFGKFVSFAHYGESNGDLMRDPDIVFFVSKLNYVYPTSFRNDYNGIDEEYLKIDGENITIINNFGYNDVLDFVEKTWFPNIKEQQGI